jgi:GNAT superfamily N-acetyltransferase
MPAGRVELRPTIDRVWLEREGARDPVTHAYALWDLERFPGWVRFVSAVRGDTPEGYLLIWQPPGRTPVVHWVGDAVEELASALPMRPLVVIGPEEERPLVERARGPGPTFSVLAEAAPRGARPPPTPLDPGVRRLTREDGPALGGLAQEATEPAGRSYVGLEPEAELIFGGFEGGTLVGVARAVVRRPEVWLVSGVYVRPQRRNAGWGRAVTRAVMIEAAQANAPSALFVREDRTAARALYDRLGFHAVGRRRWFDLGAGLTP